MKNLYPKTDEAIKVTQVENHAVTVEVNSILNMVSVDYITLANTANEAMQEINVKLHDQMPLEADNTGGEYVMERIVRHKNDHEGAEYIVRRYGYGPAVDT